VVGLGSRAAVAARVAVFPIRIAGHDWLLVSGLLDSHAYPVIVQVSGSGHRNVHDHGGWRSVKRVLPRV